MLNVGQISVLSLFFKPGGKSVFKKGFILTKLKNHFINCYKKVFS